MSVGAAGVALIADLEIFAAALVGVVGFIQFQADQYQFALSHRLPTRKPSSCQP